MRLLIAMMRDKGPGKAGSVLDVPLEQRVEYAINCLHAGETGAEHETEARDFLMKARGLLDDSSPDHRDLIKQIDEVL